MTLHSTRYCEGSDSDAEDTGSPIPITKAVQFVTGARCIALRLCGRVHIGVTVVAVGTACQDS